MQIREFRSMPFCWQDKPVLRYINNNVWRKELSSVRNVYLTLTQLSSDESSEDFKVYIFDISNLSWLSEKTVSNCLDILLNLWLVEYWKQERNSEWKYCKKHIRLINAIPTVGNFGESSKKVWLSKLPIYIEDNKDNRNNNNIATYDPSLEHTATTISEDSNIYVSSNEVSAIDKSKYTGVNLKEVNSQVNIYDLSAIDKSKPKILNLQSKELDPQDNVNKYSADILDLYIKLIPNKRSGSKKEAINRITNLLKIYSYEQVVSAIKKYALEKKKEISNNDWGYIKTHETFFWKLEKWSKANFIERYIEDKVTVIAQPVIEALEFSDDFLI